MTKRPTFIVNSTIPRDKIEEKMGAAEYSYRFILKGFEPLLTELGDVVEVSDPHTEVDSIYERCLSRGAPCVFLHFTAPHNYLSGLRCPSVLVFAWEYDSIPTDHWEGNGANDWRAGLRSAGAAIVLSEHTARAVKAAMGGDYSVAAIPTPVFDVCEKRRQANQTPCAEKKLGLHFTGVLVDSRDMPLAPHTPDREEIEELSLAEDRTSYFIYVRGLELNAREAALNAREAEIAAREEAVARDEAPIAADRIREIEDAIRRRYSIRARLGSLKQRLLKNAPPDQDNATNEQPPAPDENASFEEAAAAPDPQQPNALFIEGIIYLAVLNPYDLRKNWRDMVTAFCTAFRDTDDATLLIKISTEFITRFSDELVEHLRRLQRFSCRVVVLKAHLDGELYDQLMISATYYVNTSFGEGQCLPLGEALAAGTPAIAPRITAMEDYIDESCCFIPPTRIEPTYWQHDPRKAYRTRHHRIDWTALVEAYQESYSVAKQDHERYAQMSRNAIAAARRHSSSVALREKLASFLVELPHLSRDGTSGDTAKRSEAAQ